MGILVATGLLLLALAAAVAGAAAGWFGVAVLAMVVLAAAALAVVARAYRSPAGPPRAAGDPPAATDPAASARERCVGTVSWALHGPREADASLRPALARIADTLLDARTGRGLRTDPAAARRLLGSELFTFVDPARAIRGHDEGGGLTVDVVERMLTRLEELTWR